MSGGTVLMVCSVFAAEVRALHAAHWPGWTLCTQDSMLHMRPQALAAVLEGEVRARTAAGRRVVLVYGDCCAAMAGLEALPGVARVAGKNCVEILLGAQAYRLAMHAGAFFLLPEWARRWREIFRDELGLDGTNARDLMREMHRGLVYLDTGQVPVPEAELAACAAYCGLPCEVRPTGLAGLREEIEAAAARLDGAGTGAAP